MPPLCAALGLVLTACSPQGSDFMPGASRAPAAPAGTPPPAAPAPLGAHRASRLISMPVQSDSGQPLGTVQDIVFNSHGRATHLVIDFSGKLVAIPWRIAVSSVRSGTLVLSQKRLDGAPGFAPGAWPDLGNPSWSATSDAYWTIPVDSTSRSRTRPAR